MSKEVARASGASSATAHDRGQRVASELVFVPPEQASDEDREGSGLDVSRSGGRPLSLDPNWDGYDSEPLDAREPRQRRPARRSEPRERLDRFAEPIDRYADALDRFAGPQRRRPGGAAASVFGDLFASVPERGDSDEARVSSVPAAAYRRSAPASDLTAAADWPPIPTGLFPRSARARAEASADNADQPPPAHADQPPPAHAKRPPAVHAERPPAVHADRPPRFRPAPADFAARSSDPFVSSAERARPALLFSESVYPADQGTLAPHVSEPWLLSAPSPAAPPRDEIVLRRRSDVQSAALTVLFAVMAIAGVVLFIYLGTPLLG